MDSLQGPIASSDEMARLSTSLVSGFAGLRDGSALAVAGALLKDGAESTADALRGLFGAGAGAVEQMARSVPVITPSAVATARATAETHLQCGDARLAALALAAVQDWGRAFALAASHGSAAVQEVQACFVRVGLHPGELAGVWLKAAGPGGVLPDEQLPEWRNQALTVMASRRATAQSSLLHLATRLWDETHDPWASQGLLLLAGAKLQHDTPGAKLVLLGCDHAAERERFRRDCRAWQLTEAYELGETMSGLSAPASQLHPFRLLYAMQLADYGLRKQATAYALSCRDAVAQTMASTSGRLPFNAAFVGMLDEFVHRVCTSTGADSRYPTTAAAARAMLASGTVPRATGPAEAPAQETLRQQQTPSAGQGVDQPVASSEQLPAAAAALFSPPLPGASRSSRGGGGRAGRSRGARASAPSGTAARSQFVPGPSPGTVPPTPEARSAPTAIGATPPALPPAGMLASTAPEPAALPKAPPTAAAPRRQTGSDALASESKGADDRLTALPGSGSDAASGDGSARGGASMFDLGILSSGLSGIRSMFIPKSASLVTFEVPAEELEAMKKEQQAKLAAASGPPIMPPADAAAAGPQPSVQYAPPATMGQAAPGMGDGSADSAGPPPSTGRRGRKRIVSRYVNTFGASS